MRKRAWNNFIIGFVNGIVIILPITVTIAVVKFLVVKLNNIVLSPLLKIIIPMGVENVYVAKTLIFIAVIFIITLIGWAARIIIIRRFFSWGEQILIMVPIMGNVYNAVKQISSAVIGHGKTIFKEVVLVEYPRKGLYSLGFTTGITRGELKGQFEKGAVNVFVPTTPNPTSGLFIVVPQEEVRYLKMSVEDGMKLIISGGFVTPYYNEEKTIIE